MSLDQREFRNALGRFATGVCVITANPEGEAPIGMTVNSFGAVSLDPPLVLWSIQKDSECFPLFEKATQYGVNILSEDQQALSNQYAKKGQHDLVEGTFRQGSSGVAVLKDVMTSFECDIESRIDGGDHVILLGRVLEMTTHPAERNPLVFYAGKYRELK
ncbi:p-hydroxyphenylacetate 3-hydroxylase, reductase component [BD1-7 clade bacterium]|uniref:p-hydroxyphenylacetate 3-hydroxylase, reductase component n=1 Tax=BD1-7 clade bacterium TaxID=2029982 RepID=A0A5S9QNC3_9GAMM|nr:p-hydroxyphenylacetate 3-hydroxylase, reductase component [BD1-7 clade bacterium]CAA0119256.1 p-hydroxyphenylacetate 3-hydroxylase, reductase component [BD1-7 clade bacterium]CAA0120633.1 p-hydroxyphenylacetate 3-hydroxylase, reductase component [BD1-7 clade bacterium]